MAITSKSLLEQKIIDKILSSSKESISFAEFMHDALYHPKLGYYSSTQTIFGPKGDFTTAPELGNIFAKCLAKQIKQIIINTPNPSILEFGAGTGKLAYQLLKLLNEQIDKYYIVEISSSLRARQQEFLQKHLPNDFNKIIWLDDLDSIQIDGVILANEVVDAIPINCFYKENKHFYELSVGYDKNNFTWKQGLLESSLTDTLSQWDSCFSWPTVYQSEINLNLSNCLSKAAKALKSGAMMIFDYGFPRHEYYHPDRCQGTLICHHQHTINHDPFKRIGKQDITAHVDFSAIADVIIEKTKLDILGYCNLSSFLINCDLINILDKISFNVKNEINTLTSPAEMGELFKVFMCGKNIDEQLIGFTANDKQYTLF